MTIGPKKFWTTLWVLLVISIVTSTTEYIDHNRFSSIYIGWLVLAGTEFLGLIILLRTGELIKSRVWKFMRIAILLAMIGALMQILHLPGARITTNVSWLLVAIIYVIWFFIREPKKPIDFLKLFWVVLAFGTVLLNGSSELEVIGHISFWTLIIWSYLSYSKSQSKVSN